MAYVAIFINGSEVERHALGDCTSFGRSSRCDVRVRDENVSREHCRLERNEFNEFTLFDLSSTNGTWLDHARVKRYALRDGETFYIGDTRIVFHVDQWIEHRPADPHEAALGRKVLNSTRSKGADDELSETTVLTPLGRPLPNPRATVVAEPDPDDEHARKGPLVPIAFLRPPARPIVKANRSGGWIGGALQRLRRGSAR
jgi:pSer/pThr/pTyr-binding forkhead associated (FHA) protein